MLSVVVLCAFVLSDFCEVRSRIIAADLHHKQYIIHKNELDYCKIALWNRTCKYP